MKINTLNVAVPVPQIEKQDLVNVGKAALKVADTVAAVAILPYGAYKVANAVIERRNATKATVEGVTDTVAPEAKVA